MPIARAGGEVAIRMDLIDITGLLQGTVTAQTSALLRIVHTGGYIDELTGTFLYDATGALAGGTLTGIRQYFNGILVYEVTEISVSATQFYSWVINGQNSLALSTIFGGNDTVTGTRFDDHLMGFGGNDIIDGGGGADIMDGGAGDDIYYIDNFNDRVFDSSGFDTIVFAFNFTVNPGSNIERYVLGTGVTFGEGNNFSETIEGNVLANTILGLGGNDILRGFAGADFLRGGAGNDVIDGGDGFDTASYSDSNVGVTVNLGLTAAQVTGYGTDQLISIEQLNGSNFVDRLTGSGAAETFLGLDGNDIIIAMGGNDTLSGGNGSDSLNGGDGVDVALYSGARRQYSANASTVTGGPEGGTDTLTFIEAARFIDGTLTFDVNSQAAQIMRLYDAALDRQPDQGGFEAQLDNLERGVSLSALAEAFVNSAEFQSRYGTLSNQQFVEQLYRFCLDREGDPQGIQGWVNNLNNGLSRKDALVFFSESEEHRALTAPTLNRGLWVADEAALTIARLYDATFDRLPDAGGLAVWTANLKAGMPLIDIAAAFASAAEFQQRYGSVTNEQFIDQMYRFCLDRAPDAGGMAFWVNALNTGTTRAQMLLNFSESAEHVALTRPLWLGGVQVLGVQSAQDEDGLKGQDDLALTVPGLVGDDLAKAENDALVNGGETHDLAAFGFKLEDDAFVLPLADDQGPLVLPMDIEVFDEAEFMPRPMAEIRSGNIMLTLDLDGALVPDRETPWERAGDSHYWH